MKMTLQELEAGLQNAQRKAALSAKKAESGAAWAIAHHESDLQNVARYSAQIDALRDAQPVKVEVPTKGRCPHYKAIRRFYAVAAGAGLDCDNRKGMRAAFSALLGRAVSSRSDLTASDWGRAISGIEAGLVWW